ncbi:MAG TPA: glycosyltransferase family 2 protein [Verrucomicrobiae bacterium]|nr:glycosyltransferase family 2 protein [Verrucomicrobiae bacterium]
MKIFFWLCCGLVVYAYAGYPLLLWIVSRLAGRDVKKGKHDAFVSVILSAFNEERWIEDKIRNLLEMDYPAEKIEILIGSDGGSDKTDEIISKFSDARVKFFRFVSNFGKPHVLNGLINEARGSILVFTDARQRFDKQAIRELVDNFNDPEVGAVSGELYFEQVKGAGVSKGMDAYWKYEKFLRKMESRIGSTLGATGAIYAVRRRLFTPLPMDILVDDMYTPLSIVVKGYRVIFESRAKAFDLVSSKGKEEFKRKVRTLAGNYQIFGHFSELFDPRKSRVAWQLFSHKFLRLMVPFFMIGAFAGNLPLMGDPLYRMLFAAQALFYGLALTEWLWERLTSRKGIGYIPYTFCLLNYSALAASFRFLKKDTKGIWEKAYQ